MPLKWESDGVDGGSSSMELLLQWLAIPRNGERWLNSKRDVNGAKAELITEIMNIFQSHGITHRGRDGISWKLWHFEHQVKEAYQWLKQKGVDPFELNEEVEQKVATICPYYRQLIPLLPSSTIRPQETLTGSEGERRVEEPDTNREDSSVHCEILEELQTQSHCSPYLNPKWDSDGKNGGPSSLDVLMQWLMDDGNAGKWLEAGLKRNGSRKQLNSEICFLLLKCGITYRTCASIETKINHVVKQFNKARQYLKQGNLCLDKDSERVVLQICPCYRGLAPAFGHSLSEGTSQPQPKILEMEQTLEDSTINDEDGNTHENIENLTPGPGVRWDGDAEDGRVSSLDVVLEWLAIPGNPWRWYKSAKVRDGSQLKLCTEVYQLLLSRGITNRTISSIKTKVGNMIQQLLEAERWLERRELRRQSIDICEDIERDLLKICPQFRQIAPLWNPPSTSRIGTLQPSTCEKEITDTMEDSEDESSDYEDSPIRDNDMDTRADAGHVRSVAKSQNHAGTSTCIKWDADGINGSPSSLKLILQWLAAPGNAARWLLSVQTLGARVKISKEIYALFLSHGIEHRTHKGVYNKLFKLTENFGKAENWLMKRGLRFDVSKKAELAVLKICIEYREIAPLFRPVWHLTEELSHSSSSNSVATASWTEVEYGGDAASSDHDDQDAYVGFSGSGSKWDSDAGDGRPSSLNVLLKWVLTPGNAGRWHESVRKADGSRWELASEIYDLLLIHGIPYRSRDSVESKLRLLEEQFDKAENWMIREGIDHYQDTAEAERIVVQFCPVYATIESALRSSRLPGNQPDANMKIDIRFKPAAKTRPVSSLSRSKRVRNEHPQQPDADVRNTKRVVVLEAKPEASQEFFKLELQMKRDEAVLVRARARKELLEMGLPCNEVDRLMPL
ncbi:hypothetical protein V7S43_006559 [Phytophthora oleae]|uniref:Uncharacterized protein n=1 Tax=Phytophthora oleae TaxID=2107226 RepID=A0ABD3FQ76_9STRA